MLVLVSHICFVTSILLCGQLLGELNTSNNLGYGYLRFYTLLYHQIKVRDILVAPSPCHRISKNALTDFNQIWHMHVFGSGEEPYVKVKLNSQ